MVAVHEAAQHLSHGLLVDSRLNLFREPLTAPLLAVLAETAPKILLKSPR